MKTKLLVPDTDLDLSVITPLRTKALSISIYQICIHCLKQS